MTFKLTAIVFLNSTNFSVFKVGMYCETTELLSIMTDEVQ
jgi:hypothetical protein